MSFHIFNLNLNQLGKMSHHQVEKIILSVPSTQVQVKQEIQPISRQDSAYDDAKDLGGLTFFSLSFSKIR